MEKIELSEREIFLLKQHLKDNGYFAKKGKMIMLVSRFLSEEDDAIMEKLTEKADALAELDDYKGQMEEWNCDLLLWYYKKYLKQGNKDTIGIK